MSLYSTQSTQPFPGLNSPLTLTQSPADPSTPDTTLAMLWRQPDVRTALEERIRSRDSSVGQISEEMIVKEYFDNWREAFVSKDPLKLVMNNPALLKSDYDKIEKVMEEQKIQKAYWAAGLTVFTFFIYNVGFKSNWMFYNFFQKKHRFRVVRWLKKGLGTYAVFLVNLAGTNYIYNQKFKIWMNDSGFIEKYNLQYAADTKLD